MIFETWQLVLYGFILGLFCEIFPIWWAYAEIQIEGPRSWAQGLPCWKKTVSWFSKPITGYHVSMAGLIVSVMIFTIVVIVIASLITDVGIVYAILKIFSVIVGMALSLVLLVVMHEDFLWNVMNPSDKFGMKDFTKKYPEVGETIYVWVIPIDFIIMTVFSFAMAFVIGWRVSWGIMAIWAGIYAAMLTITLIIAAIRYRKDLEKANQN